MISTAPLSTTPRTTLKRGKNRGRTDRADLYAILDAGLVCHLGVLTRGHPMVIPTGYGRQGDTLYVHGSTGSTSLRAALDGPVCVTVTHLDGIVLARSAFHHSVNYRSAIIYGMAQAIDDFDQRREALRVITEQLAPGQWDRVRPPTRKELAATAVLAIPLAEASVKIRQGPPVDDEEDYALPIWAGVLPLTVSWGDPVPDPRLAPGIAVPPNIRDLSAT